MLCGHETIALERITKYANTNTDTTRRDISEEENDDQEYWNNILDGDIDAEFSGDEETLGRRGYDEGD